MIFEPKLSMIKLFTNHFSMPSFQDQPGLVAISLDLDTMRMQSLIIYERILGRLFVYLFVCFLFVFCLLVFLFVCFLLSLYCFITSYLLFLILSYYFLCYIRCTTQGYDLQAVYKGSAYADSLLYQQCIDLWMYVLELRISKDTYFTVQALVSSWICRRRITLDS